MINRKNIIIIGDRLTGNKTKLNFIFIPLLKIYSR